MDKTAIRNFSIEARKILMKSAITEAGFYGITKDGCKDPVQKGNDFEVYETVAGTENRIFGNDIKRRANLVQAIKTLGFDQVIEETAYTWFNRIIAIHFMEVNNYLPTRVRVLSSETGSGTPDIITQADTVELNLTAEELENIQTAKRENRYDDAFRMLFIKQCNELNAILPGLFEKTDDYMELLLKITYTGDGVIRMLVDSIPENNFNVETEGQVEIIGWMYQYYNTELKDDTFAKLKDNIKITKERIPAATQLFTPDWIVRYMVENSLGRVWIEHLRAVAPSVDEKAKAEEFGWKYYLPEAEQEEDVQTKLVEIRKSYKDMTPQDITCIDPCMGSGHILVYMFDALMDIYRSEGFSEREAVFDILEKNIRGLDIDRRAYQLSYFALMMKARGYNKIFFRGHEDIDGNRVQAVPKVYAIEESNSISRDQLKFYGAGLNEMEKNNAINQMNGLLDTFNDAKEYGSILNVDNYDWKLLDQFTDGVDELGQMSLTGYAAGQSRGLLKKLIRVGEILAQKYDAVVTNPPYMGSSGMAPKLLQFVSKSYANSKSDLSTVFMERCIEFCCSGGTIAMINIPVWMFLVSFEHFREYMLKVIEFTSCIHFGRGVFGADFGTVSFALKKSQMVGYKGIYFRLFDKSSSVDDIATKEKWFFKRKGEHVICQEKFASMAGTPIAYWVSKALLEAFEKNPQLNEVASTKQGLITGDNNRFLRTWYEVEKSKLQSKWFTYNKGGDYRKWYGNNLLVVNWENNGFEITNFIDEKTKKLRSRPQNVQYYFREGFSWTTLSIGAFSARFMPENQIFDAKGSSCFANSDMEIKNLLGLVNSSVSSEFFKILSPTVDYSAGSIGKLPVDKGILKDELILSYVNRCIDDSKHDWDSFEVSWDFLINPLVRLARELSNTYEEKEIAKNGTLKLCYLLWEKECNRRFDALKENEEKLNQIFIDKYGLQGEIEAEVEDENVTVRKADLQRDIKNLISYAAGCMFGRYSLDEDGLVFAGGTFNSSKYKTFPVDKDAVIPITDEQYFDDDIVRRFEQFVRTAFGNETLDTNLDFIAEALGTRGNSAREKIRNYFLNDFFKDHCNTYSVTGSGKKPIYWLFDSGKQNGFKCLIYLHRYTPDTVGLIRSDYLTKTQSMVENALKNAEFAINNSSSAVDRAQATKKRDKYVKQLAEIRSYYPALSHIALQRINLDLDDGVKANYDKFQGIEMSVEGAKKQKVDLLAKI